MYWDDAYDVLYRPFEERRPTAKKKHTCCEHKEPKIAVEEKYVRIAGMWRHEADYGGRYFMAHKLCLRCEGDWETVLKIFQESGEGDACIVYGRLKEAVWDAYECEYIQGDHPLIQKWYPEIYREFLKLRRRMSDEEIIWKEIEEAAVHSGLQPALPFQLE